MCGWMKEVAMEQTTAFDPVYGNKEIDRCIGSVYKRHPVTKLEHGDHGASKMEIQPHDSRLHV